jgi:hypothetical protein
VICTKSLNAFIRKRLCVIRTDQLRNLGLNQEWEQFCRKHFSIPQVRHIEWNGHSLRINKPLLIVRSDEYDFTYGNIEKVPFLRDNFIITVLQKPTQADQMVSTEAAKRFKSVPALLSGNLRCIVTLPKAMNPK